jgi:hypothetical protein
MQTTCHTRYPATAAIIATVKEVDVTQAEQGSTGSIACAQPCRHNPAGMHVQKATVALKTSAALGIT